MSGFKCRICEMEHHHGRVDDLCLICGIGINAIFRDGDDKLKIIGEVKEVKQYLQANTGYVVPTPVAAYVYQAFIRNIK